MLSTPHRFSSVAFFVLACVVSLCSARALAQPQIAEADLWSFPAEDRGAYAEYERALNAIPDPGRLSAWHDLTASRVHIAGMEGDWETIRDLERAFNDLGLETEVHEFWAYLSKPISASVEVVGAGSRGGDLALPLKESPLPGDPYDDPGEVPFAFNAYSGSGDATGEVVYANRGTLDDFQKLDELGIDCSGKIIIARYGGNYRGFKAKFAQERGASAVLIYIDPADGGYARGVMYPEGGWQTDSCIQRGSIKTLPYPGDPLTPGVEATESAERLDPLKVELPRIPVQPIGWAAAREIMSRMKGDAVPGGWQGGLPLAYRIESGDELNVRVRVEQERRLVRTANVIGTLEGEIEPEKMVIIGCHHDAWGYGASDAMSGMISLLESARSFSELAQRGERPRRSLVFCAWGAEEHGIIGSTEWVEGRRDLLTEHGVVYLNLDMAGMGPQFGSSATPDLKPLIAAASRSVPQARDAERSVHDEWVARSPDAERGDEPSIGVLGGGSDHISFNCHIGMASASFGGGGSPGTAYHTARDTLHWYRQTVGDDYEPALMITRMTNAVASRLANSPVLPLSPKRVVQDLRRHLRSVSKIGETSGAWTLNDGDELPKELRGLDARAQKLIESMHGLTPPAQVAQNARERANANLLDAMRVWTAKGGLPSRPWYTSRFAATDPESGYGSWVLPGIRGALADDEERAEEIQKLRALLDRFGEMFGED